MKSSSVLNLVYEIQNRQALLPKMSPLNPAYITKKATVFDRVSDFVAKFKGVGGQI